MKAQEVYAVVWKYFEKSAKQCFNQVEMYLIIQFYLRSRKMKLKKEFEDFYKCIRIDSETQNLIDKRETLEGEIKDKFPTIMKNHDIELNKSDIRMIDQGSYKYNTTIKSTVVDRDVAVMIPLDTSENPDPRKIKKYLKESIDIPVRSVSIKEPCVRAAYYEKGEEWLHIDLPLYANDNGEIYLARGKASSNEYLWERADPDGLNNDLCGKINGHDQLRRIICLIKKWKNEKYSSSTKDHEVPPSIGLTYLACDCFSEQTSNDGDDDLLALQKTMKSIKDKFLCTKNAQGEIVSADISRYLPVQPYTDIFKKIRDSSTSYMITFYKRLSIAVDNLTNAVNVESAHDAAEYVQKVLGPEFTVPAKEAVAVATQSKKEHSFG